MTVSSGAEARCSRSLSESNGGVHEGALLLVVAAVPFRGRTKLPFSNTSLRAGRFCCCLTASSRSERRPEAPTNGLPDSRREALPTS